MAWPRWGGNHEGVVMAIRRRIAAGLDVAVQPVGWLLSKALPVVGAGVTWAPEASPRVDAFRAKGAAVLVLGRFELALDLQQEGHPRRPFYWHREPK